jgi:hypothetical protein
MSPAECKNDNVPLASKPHHHLKAATSAAIELYCNHLKEGCEQMIAFNTLLLKAERQQRIKQILYRLGWVGGLSSLVVIVSYLFTGINVLTAVGLLVAYFVGLLLHHKFSPGIVLPEEEQKLVELNDQLRQKIVTVEKQAGGVLFPLLEVTDLEEQARDKGLRLEKAAIDIYQLDGSGLYQYLDAINLLMANRERLPA